LRIPDAPKRLCLWQITVHNLSTTAAMQPSILQAHNSDHYSQTKPQQDVIQRSNMNNHMPSKAKTLAIFIATVIIGYILFILPN
jgi:hypothetical protein